MDSRHKTLIELKEAKKNDTDILSPRSSYSSPQGEILDQVEPCVPASPSSAWFREQFDILYKEVVEFVNTNFCQSENETTEHSTSPWIDGMPQELLNYTKLVAEADESPDSWDMMLLDRKKRGHLLVGVLGRILEAHVFRDLLFGASSLHQEQLEREEAILPGREGFSRTAARARNIAKVLGDRHFPVDFQTTVVRLSRQITILLLPLWRLLQITDASTMLLEPKEVQFIDGVKNIVSTAGELSVHIRKSPTIIYFDFESPGSSFLQNGQDSIDDIDQEALVASKNDNLTRLADNPSKEIGSMKKLYHITVKISVWPSIKRYLPGNGQVGGEKRGFRIYDICNSRVVYHWRLKDRRDGAVESLSRFVELKERGQLLKSGSRISPDLEDQTTGLNKLRSFVFAV